MKTRKRTFKNLLKFGVFLFGISLLLWNCNQRENLLTEEKSQLPEEILEIKDKFSLDNFKNASLKENLLINWNDYIKNNDNQENSKYEFSTFFKTQVTFDKGEQRIYIVYNLLATKNTSNNWELELIKFIPNNTNKILDVKTTDLKHFSGTLNYYNLEGKLLKSARIEDGKQMDLYIPSEKSSNIPSFSAPIGSGCHRIEIITYHWVDWYFEDPDSGEYYYVESVETGITYEYIWVCDDYTDNPDGGNQTSEEDLHIHFHGSGGENDTTDNHPEEIIIDSSFKDTKADCIYKKLNNLSTSFKNAIKKFDGEFPVAHLKFKMNNLGNKRATTEAPDGANGNNNSPDYVITITLNNNSNEHGVGYRPNLMTVKTIAHEIIHAEMYRKLLSVLDNGGNISGVTRQDILDALDGNFPGMYDYYRRHKNWQHQQMATHYRGAIARIMQEYDTGSAVPNNQQPSQLYMDLAWDKG